MCEQKRVHEVPEHPVKMVLETKTPTGRCGDDHFIHPGQHGMPPDQATKEVGTDSFQSLTDLGPTMPIGSMLAEYSGER